MSHNEQNQRLHPRYPSLNLIAYDCLNEHSEVIKRGMGRTINISESGILLETHVRIAPETRLLLGIGLEDDLVQIHGRAAYCKPGSEQFYETGIEFEPSDEAQRKVILNFIQLFEGRDPATDAPLPTEE